MNRYMEEAVASHVSREEKESPFGNSKAKFSSIVESNNNQSNGFECNICLDTVQDPVVTLCGHLFCWPCIYKWLKLQDISAKELEEQQQNRCPVCKAEVSCTSLIPLYGRGQTTQPTKDKDRDYGITIPRRPLAPAVQPNMSGSIDAASATLPTQPPYGQNFAFQSQPYYSRVLHHPEQVSPMVTLSGTTTSIICPIVGIVGEMVYGRHFGNLVTSLYAYPNSYHTAASSGRIRRHVQEAEKSLNRICFFLYCCIFLFLLLL